LQMNPSVCVSMISSSGSQTMRRYCTHSRTQTMGRYCTHSGS
jgi:hypothetical protein